MDNARPFPGVSQVQAGATLPRWRHVAGAGRVIGVHRFGKGTTT